MILAPKVWAIRLLYLDADIRSAVQQRIIDESNERGWLVSDIRIDEITTEEVHGCYRAHIRGKDTETCFTWPL